jgi:hypothetical protein
LFRARLDEESKETGLKHVEQLLFVNLMIDIQGTNATGDKILAFMHKCAELNMVDSKDNWVRKYLPKRYSSLKKKVSKRLKKINDATDARAG